MKRLEQQKGFTLVELAIVLTIIGLLIGGILKGQQLMQNARVTATIAQVNAIEAATTTFRDTYNAIPGDMSGAQLRIPNCAGCANTNGNIGNGIVGVSTWDITSATATANVAAAGSALESDEPLQYWAELAQAGLLSGITNAGITGAAGGPTFGTSLPSARVGGGWLVGNSNGSIVRNNSTNPAAPNNTVSMTGLVLLLTTSAQGAAPNTLGTGLLTPTIAAQMDRKMDDGTPTSGFAQAYGFTGATGCYNVAAAPFGYNEAVNEKDCGLIFRIQG